MKWFAPSLVRVGLLNVLLCGGILAADGPKSFRVSEFTFQRPASWTWIKTASPMRVAHLQVPASQGSQPADVVFYYFGPQNGGGTQANVERWLSQFKEPKSKINARVNKINPNGRTVTFVQAEGTYMNGSPRGPKTPQPNSALMAAILESKQGNVFVKMTGPAALTQAAIPAFKKMIQDALP